MTLSEFSFRIILLFMPGIISFFIADKLTNHKEPPLYKILVLSLIYGFIAYLLYYVVFIIVINNIFDFASTKITVLNLTNYKFHFSFVSSLSDQKTSINFLEIMIVAGLSFPMGLLIAYCMNQKVLIKIAHKLKVTKKFGDTDVWSYIMNLDGTEWVVVRDLDYDLMYQGWVHAFSDGEEKDELFLRDVKVFKNSTGEELYNVQGLYVPRKREGLTIELQSIG